MIVRLTESAWVGDDGELHLSVPAMLDEMGVPDTSENRDRCQKMAEEILKEMLKNTPAVIKLTK